AWRYLLSGPDIIHYKYKKAKGKPFEVLAPDTRYVFVSSPTHIKELDRAPDNMLSLYAASSHMLQPEYTMHGYAWFDRKGTGGFGFVRVIRTLLTRNIPTILPDLTVMIKKQLADLQTEDPIFRGARHSSVYELTLNLVVLSNALVFFGPELARDRSFMNAALAYVEETVMGAEIIRLMPSFVAPVIGRIVSSRIRAQEKVFDVLYRAVEQRRCEKSLAKPGHFSKSYADCIEWILETCPEHNTRSTTSVVHELMAIWFGSVHGLAMTLTFAIHDLCLHPEYIEPLRYEIETQYDAFQNTGNGLPLLDSFIKESARLTPVESLSTRRQAVQPFALSDGTKLEVGDWACTPVRSIMLDPTNYPEPSQFSGFRFADPGLLHGSYPLQPQPSKLTDVDEKWQMWGTGRMTCPGRFYAAAVMKAILAQIILGYKCRLVDPTAPRSFAWRSTTVPRKSTRVAFEPR
ncbi:cytochrome P450, partial [Aspergillus steynii IBT 23096]